MQAQLINPQSEDVSGWFYVEVFGHTVVCGRLTTRKIGTAAMFQVDIPKGENEFSHSQMFSPSSIFSMTPTTEEYCRKFNAAREKNQYPVLPYIPTQRMLGAGDIQNDLPLEY